MHGKALNYREACNLLKSYGFFYVRNTGDHAIWRNSRGQTVNITSSGKKFSQKTFNRECKRVGIEVSKLYR